MAITLGPAAWAAKTAPEVREIGRADGSVAIVPVGSIEQHGEHLPVATDTLLVDAVAHRGAAAADEVPALVTPPIWHGNSPHHLPFGGTVTTGVRGLIDVLEAAADSVLENGFDAILLLNGHGGNASTVDAATSAIGRNHPAADVLGLTYFDLAASFIDDLRESDPGGMAHAGEFETSLMLALYPELVREEAMAATPMDEPYSLGTQEMFDPGPLSVYRSFDEYADSGALGDPRAADAETGEELLDRLEAAMATLLGEVHEQNR